MSGRRLLLLGKIQLNLGVMTSPAQRPVVRLITYSTLEDQFRREVSARDRKCVISGRVNNLIQLNMWLAFHAAPEWATLLVDASLHNLFEYYGYKIISLLPNDMAGYGRILVPVYRDPTDPNRALDGLLRWHFRQSVFANMQGAEESVSESDLPRGTDKTATLRRKPYGKERFEMEIESRPQSVGWMRLTDISLKTF